MRRLICVTLLILLTITISAQDGLSEQPYQLHQPSMETYVSAIPEALDQWKIDMEDNARLPQLLVVMLSHEALTRYQNELQLIDSSTPYHVFEVLSGSAPYDFDREAWLHTILLAWLRENQPNLSTQDAFTIAGLDIQVTRRDFNGDEQDEYVFEVQSDIYSQYIVLESTDSGYAIVPSPLPWYGCCFAYYSPRSGLMEEQYFGDLNDDGLPEWVLAEGGYGGGHMNHGQLFILQWQDRKLVDISTAYENWWDINAMTYRSGAGGGAPLFPNGVEVSFQDVDIDSRIEVVVSQTFHDNWDCISYDTRIFDWNDAIRRYDLESHSRELENSSGCNLMQAQSAMWEDDYTKAIALYEKALGLFNQEVLGENEYRFPNRNDAIAYTRVRLGLAYAMTGQLEEAYHILETVSPAPTDSIIIDLVHNAQEVARKQGEAIDLCILMLSTAFNQYYQLWESNPYWGTITDIVTPWMAPNSSAPPPNAEKAGCEIQQYVDNIISSPVKSVQNPVNYLYNSHIPVARYIDSDFNQDGQTDWIIWLDGLRTNPLLYVSSNQMYKVTQPYLMSYVEELVDYTQWFNWELPDSTPVLGLLFLDNKHSFWKVWEYLYGSGGGGTIGYCTDAEGEFDTELFAGQLKFYALVDDELRQVFSAKVCEPIALEELFPDGTSTQKISAWYADTNEYEDYPIVPATYVWDEDAGTYIPAEMEETAQPAETPPETTASDTFYLNSYELIQSTRNHAFETVINLVTEYIEKSENGTDFTNDETRTYFYYRAFAYEQLGRVDEALADYVTLNTQAPDTAWGMLADLHIQPLES